MIHYTKSTSNSVWYPVKYYHYYLPSAGDETMAETDITLVLTDFGSCGNEPVSSLTPGSMKDGCPVAGPFSKIYYFFFFLRGLSAAP